MGEEGFLGRAALGDQEVVSKDKDDQFLFLGVFPVVGEVFKVVVERIFGFYFSHFFLVLLKA